MNELQSLTGQSQAFENQVLERLNVGRSVRCLLIAAVEMLADAVNMLVEQVFRKDDYAVKYAVEPLLHGDGPLAKLSVRLKLIYGLGAINRHEYEDCERLMALREALNHDGSEYRFTDDEIVGPISALHCMSTLPAFPDFASHDAELRVMQQQRYQQVVRSTMVLSLTALISRLSLRRAFKK
ncbi:MltR family transcriptional regulator [Erwinia amylovora]|uniref:MltR family transcriptional regulator n=1 Tax=Erwinia amylovora TaxID=552 RepID=UPI001443E992|nr:MltR family transcriptional regulator [Erwinia amylovora]